MNIEKYLKHKKNNSAIFSACDDKYAFCLYVSLSTFIQKSPALASTSDILVAGYHLTKQSKQILETLPHVSVIDYSYPLQLPNTPAIDKFTAASFARYDCFALLVHYEQVLYLDSDVLVQRELLPVFKTLKDGIGLIADPTFTTVRNQFYKPIDGFDMNRKGFNSGFLVLSRHNTWSDKYAEITDWCYQKTNELAEALFLPDQGIINLSIEHFNLSVSELSNHYNCPASSPTKKLKSAYIIHSTGPRKFWCYYYFGDFYFYYSRWISLGGSVVGIRFQDSFLYKKLLAKSALGKKVFFQLCPDFFTKPLKFLRFWVKYLLKVSF